VEQWFSDRVRTVMESAADLGRTYVRSFNEDMTVAVQDMATDLNRVPARLTEAPDEFQRYLMNSANQRLLTAAYVLDGSGRALAGAQTQGAPPFAPPVACAGSTLGGSAFDQARAGVAVCLFKEQALVTGLLRLEAYPDAYLYVIARIDPAILNQLNQFDQALTEYRDSEQARARLQGVFVLAYVATAVLVLLGAVWLGLYNAGRVSRPIGALADAARQVAAGDLSARVLVADKRDEISALGNAFNAMTAQLETQRSALVRARVEAETRTDFTEAVLSGVSAGVVGLDAQGKVTAANASAALLLDVEPVGLIGRRLIEAAPEFAELLASLNEAGPVARRIDLVRGGQTRHLSVRVGENASGAVLTFDDMTKLIAAQRQEAWKDVARRIAHEIKNPLTPIQLSAERLQRKYAGEITSDPETFKRCTETILRQVSDIGRMVDEFSAFARMPAPRMEPADLADLARAAVFAQRLGASDIRFQLAAPDSAILACDGRLIAQVLTNVLKNAGEAIQARRAKDGEPKEGVVQLRLTEQASLFEIEIQDNGIGFPAVGRSQLVEPYVTTRTKGTGLGLAIVRRIVEDHGGVLVLDDAPGASTGTSHGALVRISLPKSRPVPLESPKESA
jgi:two-component system nitrogen regulation sensor histidine kinase NtrY